MVTMDMKNMVGIMSLSLYDVFDILFEKQSKRVQRQSEFEFEFNDVIFKISCEAK